MPRGGTKKPTVVVLHGTAGNAEIVKFQVAALARKLTSEFDVVYVDAPKVCDESNRHAAMMRRVFGAKQILREFAVATEVDGWRTYDDLERRLQEAEEVVARHEPVSALIAFSQGANFATMLVARAEQRGATLPSVLMCGARPGWARQLPELFTEKKLRSPAFLVAAENDPVVDDGPAEMAKLFADSSLRFHRDGHKPLPSQKPDLDDLTDAIAAFLSKSLLLRT